MTETALITGASSGIGLELAHIFAQNGHNLVLVARSLDKLNNLKEELSEKHKIKVIALGKDLSDMEQVQSVYDELQEKNVHIDYLVNNAGFGVYDFFHKSSYEKLDQMMNLNMRALTLLCHLFINPMVEKGKGRVLNVASTAAFQPGPTMAVYYASKAYVLHLSEAFSNELKDTGVTVTTLCPGATKTEFLDAADLYESRLIKGRKLPSAKEVAIYGYKHMMQGSLTVIPGTLNYLLAQSVRFAPRKVILKIVRFIQGKA